MNDKAKFILFSIFDFAFTFGGSAGVIVYNYVSQRNPVSFKITLTGIVLVIALLLTAKAVFEHGYRQKYDSLLQQLAEATEDEEKKLLSKAIERHKTTNNVYQRLMLLLPFAVLYAVSCFGAQSLESLRGCVGIILLSMTCGSVFNIIKKPVWERLRKNKILKKGEDHEKS